MRTLVPTTLALALLGAGCGGAAMPRAALTDAEANIRSAEVVGANDDPQASYHLELARDQLTRAEEMIARGRMQDAERLLMRASADAELAVALARVDDAREAAQMTEDRIRDLREQHL